MCGDEPRRRADVNLRPDPDISVCMCMYVEVRWVRRGRQACMMLYFVCTSVSLQNFVHLDGMLPGYVREQQQQAISVIIGWLWMVKHATSHKQSYMLLLISHIPHMHFHVVSCSVSCSVGRYVVCGVVDVQYTYLHTEFTQRETPANHLMIWITGPSQASMSSRFPASCLYMPTLLSRPRYYVSSSSLRGI